MKNEKIALVNPWSGSEAKMMTWTEIRAWAVKNINVVDQANWLRHARRAYLDENGEKLGSMIIGS